MRFICCCASFACLLALGGCQRNQYELQLQPEGRTLRRELSAWREQGDNVVAFPAEEMRRVAEAYGEPVPSSLNGKHRFQGRFVGRTPQDVGGAGWLLHWDTNMGAVSVYSERFRGQDDLEAELQARLEAVNRIVDLLISWLQAEFADAPDLARIRDLLDQVVRRDMRNLCLYTQGFSFTFEDLASAEDASQTAVQTLLVQMAMYAAERNYFDPQQLPLMIRAVEQLEHRQDERPLLQLVTRSLAAKLGVAASEPLPPTLALIRDDWDRLQASLDQHLQQSPEYQELLQQQMKSSGRRRSRPPGAEVLAQHMARAYLPDPDILAADDHLRVELRVPVRPFASNGQYEDGRVTWQCHIAAADRQPVQMPDTLFAAWSEPKAEYQQQHFGRLVLDGEQLGAYCLWRKSLTEEEGRQWDEFVAQLEPGPALAEQLQAFRFDDEAGAKDSRAGDVVEQMVAALEKQERQE